MVILVSFIFMFIFVKHYDYVLGLFNTCPKIYIINITLNAQVCAACGFLCICIVLWTLDVVLLFVCVFFFFMFTLVFVLFAFVSSCSCLC